MDFFFFFFVCVRLRSKKIIIEITTLNENNKLII